ncbi:MAG: lipoate--protein ligase family protein [Lachnospiraceae bacterium]|nr:lipoate--protein ligase family protein [Lachnospiraceae bacterium]
MPKKLPKGVRQICFREKTGFWGNSEQICGCGNRAYEDKAGRFYGIRVLQSDSRDAEENLSVEEELTEQAERGVLCLLFWQNEDCVVIGRHQDPEAECCLDAAESMGIRIVRRRTGGGAVFQDPGNLNVSFIAYADSLDEAICEEILLKALEKCGVDACKTGRNDLVLKDAGPEISGMKTVESVKEEEDFRREESSGEGGKFSGSASRETPEGIFLFHATLMFDVDLDRMTAVLNASPAKLARHRIASVRSRVTNLCDRYPDLKMETVKGAIISEGAEMLTDAK